MVGIQIHSVDNNAAVPWEYYPNDFENDTMGEVMVGQLAKLNGDKLDRRVTTLEYGPLYILMSKDENGEIPAVRIRDDMVLEGYVLEGWNAVVMLGGGLAVITPEIKDGLYTSAFVPAAAIPNSKTPVFECVGLLEADETITSTDGDTATRKALARLAK